MTLFPAIVVFAAVFLFFSKDVLTTKKEADRNPRNQTKTQANYKETQKYINRAAISELFINDKYEDLKKTSIICFCVFVFLLATTSLSLSEFEYIHLLLLIPIILLFIYIKITEYRIQNGLYASNEYEARELIEFIEENSDSFDDDNNGMRRKAISDTVRSGNRFKEWDLEEEVGRLA